MTQKQKYSSYMPIGVFTSLITITGFLSSLNSSTASDVGDSCLRNGGT
jgi:hypothetical protein